MTQHTPDSDDDAPDPQARARAIQSLLIEKNLITPPAIDDVLAAYEEDIGPMNGARVVARAWRDPRFKDHLLEDARSAIEAEGFNIPAGLQHLAVVENTPDVHNVVVCTLCSCYPWSLLGLPPTWYKAPAYRSRMVREPRSVLEEFGLVLDPAVAVEVWDSSSEVRYMVLPQQPTGTEELTEQALAELVSRDAMIGVAKVDAPSDAPRPRGEHE